MAIRDSDLGACFFGGLGFRDLHFGVLGFVLFFSSARCGVTCSCGEASEGRGWCRFTGLGFKDRMLGSWRFGALWECCMRHDFGTSGV